MKSTKCNSERNHKCITEHLQSNGTTKTVVSAHAAPVVKLSNLGLLLSKTVLCRLSTRQYEMTQNSNLYEKQVASP